MKFIKWFFYLVIFLLIGELVVRLDKHLKPFAEADVVKTAIKLGESQELTLLTNHSLPINNNDLRVMILGDSYIYGAGINPENNFSNKLRLLLKQSAKNHKNIYVLDVSRPSNNTLDNYNTYFKFVNEFNPNVVVLAYNLNDINGSLDIATDSATAGKPLALPTRSQDNPSTIKKIYNVLYTSELVHLTMNNLNKQLKSFGYVIPSSQFGQELQAYYTNASSWVKSKELLSKMLTDANNRNIKFISFLMPEMDLLKNPEIFYPADTSIQNFFNSYANVKFINGRDVFKKEDGAAYRLSKYDGHPNEKAHLHLAMHSYKTITELQKQSISYLK